MLKQFCPECGKPVPSGSPHGKCPVCLLRLGLPAVAPRDGPPLFATAAPGDWIGPYKLLEQIGEGGFGSVWMAEQQQPIRRQVALKILKLGMDTCEVVARFEAERQALAMMDHPNIAKVLDAGATESGRPFFVMELVRGVRITDYCDEHKLTLPERLELFSQVCQAVQHAHQKGVIHRDLKPGNILVAEHDGKPLPKVIDFGVAKALEEPLTDKTLVTRFHQFLGTPAYVSPEQAGLGGQDIDTRSDIYSLGVLLYELLVGHTPFDPADLMRAGVDEMRRTIREQEPALPSARWHALDEKDRTTTAQRRRTDSPKLLHELQGDLDWIVMKCLEKDRVRRYETANALAMDLRRHLDTEPVLARPPSRLYLLEKMVRRNKLLVSSAALVTTSLLVGLGISTVLFLREKDARRRAVEAEQKQESLRDQADTARENETRGRLQAEQHELDARRQLYVADMNLVPLALQDDDLQRANILLNRHLPSPGQPDLREWEWRYLWHQAQSDEIATLGLHSSSVKAVSFSPDGKWLASGSMNGEVRLWEMPGQRLVETFTVPGGILSLSFSPDSQRLVVGGYGRVSLWRLTPSTQIADASRSANARVVRFSPDGRRIATYWRNGEIVISEAETLKQLVTFKADSINGDARGALVFSPDGTTLAIGSRKEIILIDPENGSEQTRWQAHEQEITGLVFTPDGTMIASCEWGPAVKLWDVATRQLKQVMEGPGVWASALAISPDGSKLAASTINQVLRLWDLASGKSLGKLRGHVHETWCVAFSPDGEMLASGASDQAVKLWKSPLKLEQAFQIPGGRGLIRFSPDEKRFAVSLTNGSVQLGDGTTLLPTGVLQGQKFEPTAIRFSPDGTQLATGDSEGWLDIWDANTRQRLRRVLRNEGGIRHLHFATNGQSVCWIESQGNVMRCDLRTGIATHVTTFTHKSYGEHVVTFSPDHRFLAGGDGFSAQVINLDSGHLETILRGAHTGHMRKVALSPDGRWLAIGAEDSLVSVWDMATRTNIVTIQPHLHNIIALGFASGGRRMFTRGGENVIKLWDTTTWQEVLVLRMNDAGGADEIGFNGTSLFVADNPRGNYRLWRPPSFEEICRIDARVTSPASLTKAGATGETPAELRWADEIEILSRRGQWKDALTHGWKLVRLQPDNHEHYRSLAPLLVVADDMEGYRELCQIIYERFGQSRIPYTAESMAKACSLSPRVPINSALLETMADTGLVSNWVLPWNNFAKALTEYRRGNYSAATNFAHKSFAPIPYGDEYRFAGACFVLAMAHHQLKEAAQAQAELNKGGAIVENQLPRLDKNDLGPFWRDWIIAHELMKEAKALVGGK